MRGSEMSKALWEQTSCKKKSHGFEMSNDISGLDKVCHAELVSASVYKRFRNITCYASGSEWRDYKFEMTER